MRRAVWIGIGSVLALVALAVGGIFFVALFYEELESIGSEAPPSPPPATPGNPDVARQVVVLSVHDGDTLHIEENGSDVTVRLLGVDTPEIGEELECYGTEAADLLKTKLAVGSVVWVLGEREELDQYGRALLHVFAEDGTHINLWLLEQGAAEALSIEPNTLYEAPFASAEADARAAGLGMWSACAP